MSESYFAHYVSPNIIIVPTVSFSPPHTENNTNPINSSSRLLSFEQNTSKDISETSGSDCSKHEVINTNLKTIDSTCISEHSKNLPFIKEDIISNEDQSTNMIHGIKELSSSKYKSRNNLVDLTGFNILKRDNMSSVTKHEDSKSNPEATIDHNSDTNKKDYKTNKISSKGSIGRRKIIHWEGHTNKELKQPPPDMEDNMKKYFRHLWRHHSIEKINDKSCKEIARSDSKSNRTRENAKNSKLESSRNKSKLKKDYIKKSKTKEYRDFERNFIAEYSSRSKSETKSSKAAAADREKYLSSIAMKRYKDFQNFIRHQNGNGTEHKTEKHTKTESLHCKKINLKLEESNTNNSEVKKKVAERKRFTKNELHTRHTNLERVKSMKSVVQMTNQHAHINTQNKYINENQDLRSRLTRKRSRNECLTHSKQIQGSQLERENLVITLKQDLNTDPKKKAKSAKFTKKPKKFKKIKLVINIECSNTDDSYDSDPDETVNECCTSPQDLSFLDDFNVDEIVDSLNVCHNPIENEKINTPQHSHFINETIKKGSKIYATKESTPKDRPIDDLNTKTKNIQKIGTRKNKTKEVVVIDSDAEDLDIKTKSVIKTSLNQGEEKIKTNSENAKNMKQESRNVNKLIDTPKQPIELCEEKDDSIQEIIDISLSSEDVIVYESNNELIKLKRFDESFKERALGSSINIDRKTVNNIKQKTEKEKKPLTKPNENAKSIKQEAKNVNKLIDTPKQPIDLCDEKDDSIQEIIDITHEKKYNKTANVSLSTEDVIVYEFNNELVKLKRFDESVKERALGSSINISRKTVKNIKQKTEKEKKPLIKSNENAKIRSRIHLQKIEDKTEKTLETMKIDKKRMFTRGDERLSLSDRKETENNLQKSKDPIEVSLQSIFNNIDQSIKMDIDQLNGKDRIKEETNNTYLQKSGDGVETSLETMFNNIKQEPDISMEIVSSNISSNHIIEEARLLQKAEEKSRLSLVIPNNNTEKNAEMDVQNSRKSANTLKNSLNAVKYSIEQKDGVQIDIKPGNRFCERVKGKAELLQNSKDTTKTSTLTNNTEKKTNINLDIRSSKKTDKNIKEKAEHRSQKTENITQHSHGIVKTNSKQKAYVQMDIEPLDRSCNGGKVKNLQKPKEIIKKSLETPNKPMNMEEKNTNEKIENYSRKSENNNKKSRKMVNNHIELETDMQGNISPQSKSSKNIKEKSEDLQKSKDTIKASLQIPKNKNVEMGSTIIDIKPSKTSDTNTKEQYLKKSKDTTEKRLNTVKNMNSQKSEKTNKKLLKTVNNNVKLKTGIEGNIPPQRKSGKNNKEKSKDRQTSNDTIKTSLEIPTKKIAEKGSIIIDIKSAKTSDINIDEIHLKNPEDITEKPLKAVKNMISQKSENTNKKSLRTVKNNTELKTDLQRDIISISKSGKNTKNKSEDLQKSKNTINTSLETPTNTIAEKASIIIDVKPSKTSDLNIKEKYLEISEGTTENPPKTLNNMIAQQLEIQMDIEPMNELVENIKENATHLPKSEVIPEKSQESVKISYIQHKIKITENVETSTCSDKNTEANRPSKIFIATTEKPQPTVNHTTDSVENNDTNKTVTKSNTEAKRVASQETVKNEGPISGTMDVELSKTEDSNTKSTKTEDETKKHDVMQMETKSNTGIKQTRVYNNEKKVSNDTDNTDFKIQKEETKSNKVEVKSSPHWKPFVETLENRMLNYLDEKYTVTSLIHKGNFSVIYKCEDVKGDNYALKVINFKQRRKAVLIDGMLLKLQKYTSKWNSNLLYIISSFGVEGLWCFMSDFYPHNLQQALKENKQSFHIDLVQVLSRQLVAAVNMLSDNDIMHSDIKPSHILLNSAKDRLKLTGFDRSDYSSSMQVLPCTGSASYRAPEIILGFLADCRIDIWSTALVMFEMATATKLFPGIYNNDILYKQICTLGSFEMDMISNSRFANIHFFGSSFIRKTGLNGEKSVLIHAFQRNDKLRNQIKLSYKYQWEPHRTSWQVTKDLDKLETFHRLLEQMLVLDPRHRLPIQFVSASEFIHDMFA